MSDMEFKTARQFLRIFAVRCNARPDRAPTGEEWQMIVREMTAERMQRELSLCFIESIDPKEIENVTLRFVNGKPTIVYRPSK